MQESAHHRLPADGGDEGVEDLGKGFGPDAGATDDRWIPVYAVSTTCAKLRKSGVHLFIHCSQPEHAAWRAGTRLLGSQLLLS
jgi:hypothetical protein